jgi:predicted TIM-barrel fold metal-dependent hydrolase
MAATYPIIDADGHVLEKDRELADFLEGRYREMQRNETYGFFPSLDGWHRGFSAAGKETDVPAARWLEFLDELGVRLSVLYPTAGLAHGLIQDPNWACAVARAYNNWVAERYTRESPRLKAVALLPVQMPEEAAKELKRAKEIGLVAGLLPAVTVLHKGYGHKDFDPIYREAERLDVPLAVHGAPSRGMGFDFFDKFIQVHTLEHPFAILIQFTHMIYEGVFERFPKLRVAFLEAGSGWLPYMMDRLDYEYGTRGASSFRQIKKKPSDYVKECPVYVTCEPEETSLAYVAKVIGDDRLMFPSDYPHERVYGEFLKDIPELLARPELSDHTKQKILYDNAKEFYRI